MLLFTFQLRQLVANLNRGIEGFSKLSENWLTGLSGYTLGPNTDLLDFAYRYDRCHFTEEGLERTADLWVQALEMSTAPHFDNGTRSPNSVSNSNSAVASLITQ